MIQNLNPISFKNFGTILNSGKVAPTPTEERTGLTLPHAQLPIRRTLEHVQLYPDPGLCVLSVSHDGESYAHFYLDKPVALADNILFFLSHSGRNDGIQNFFVKQEILPQRSL